jgi:hypothetical protein
MNSFRRQSRSIVGWDWRVFEAATCTSDDRPAGKALFRFGEVGVRCRELGPLVPPPSGWQQGQTTRSAQAVVRRRVT